MLINKFLKFFLTPESYSQTNKMTIHGSSLKLPSKVWIKTEVIYFWGGRGRGQERGGGRGEGEWGRGTQEQE